MSKFLNHTEKIEAYLEGSMSPDEMLDFENQLHTDPVMRSEFDLQQDIIHSLKDFRKSQLKTRLDQVPVSMGPSTLIGVKTAAVIVLTGFMGVATYLYFNSENESGASFEQEPITEQQIETPAPKEEIKSEELSENTLNEVIAEEDKAEQITNASEGEDASFIAEQVTEQPRERKESESAESKSSDKDEYQETDEAIANNTAPVANVPQVEVPDTESEATLPEESIEMPSSAIAQEEPTEDAVIEVETTKENQQLFHYQYYSGKLYLYGDFKDIPYEILELNSASGKKLFMYYNSEYFEILNDRTELTPLEKLNDQGIIEKLEIIKENK